jgi:chromosome segregation ATPase
MDELHNSKQEIQTLTSTISKPQKSLPITRIDMLRTNVAQWKAKNNALNGEQINLIGQITDYKILVSDGDKVIENLREDNLQLGERVQELEALEHDVQCDLKLEQSSGQELKGKLEQTLVELKF